MPIASSALAAEAATSRCGLASMVRTSPARTTANGSTTTTRCTVAIRPSGSIVWFTSFGGRAASPIVLGDRSGAVRLQVDQPERRSPRDRLHPAPYSELPIELGHVGLDGTRRDGEPGRDLADRETPAQECEHLPLPGRETRFHVDALSRTSRHAPQCAQRVFLQSRTHDTFTGEYASDGRSEIPEPLRLRYVPPGPQAQRSQDEVSVGAVREHEDPFGSFVVEIDQDAEAIGIGEIEIQHQEVGC